MIEFQNVNLKLGDKLIFKDFNLKVVAGERLGVTGGEGSGKSTMLDIISERVLPDSGVVNVTGKIVTVNRNIYANFSSLKLAALSESEKFKLIINRALEGAENEEKILLLDEPTKNLTGDEINWLIDLLKEHKKLTVVAASNDRYFLKSVCGRTITIGNVTVDKILLKNIYKSEEENILNVENLRKIVDGEPVFKKVSFTIKRGQKVAFVGNNNLGKTKLLKVLGAGIEVKGKVNFNSGEKKFYMPRVYSSVAAKIELQKLQESRADLLILDNPTSCLDLPTIIALEKALKEFNGTIIFADTDREFIQQIATRIIDITPDGIVDRISTLDEFSENETVKQLIKEKYKN